jgi:Kef-type K+ transport system membrane component KefB
MPHALIHVLLTLTAVVALGWLLGNLFRYLGQPAVIGEIVAGIALGPSLLGQVSPAAADYLLPADVAPYLGVISQLGVILYMFLVGLELNPNMLKGRTFATLAISHAGIALPFALGLGLAFVLFDRVAMTAAPFVSFSLFVGVAMSITAFPVLARILVDNKLQHTRLGNMALACAAIDDVTAWCLLALVVGVAQAQVSDALLVVSMAVGYVALMCLIVRPIVLRLLQHAERTEHEANGRGVTALMFVALLLSALATEAIGIHAIFGAFLFGAIIPHDSKVARTFIHKLEDTVTVLLLPAFFAFTGMRTEIGLVSSVEEWLLCGLIIVVATAGKFGGVTLVARLTGSDWRESSALGVLMNTRGLMELIVLNIGLDLKIISPTLFAMMVIMALVTTIATTPILHRVWIKQQLRDGNDKPFADGAVAKSTSSTSLANPNSQSTV